MGLQGPIPVGEAPKDIRKGYATFGTFYRHNYMKHIPENRDARILVVSCGPGYFVHLLSQAGYRNVLGIDSDPEKIRHATEKNLNCVTERAFPFLSRNQTPYDVIIGEQEINHLTKDEILAFLELCRRNLSENGTLVLHSLNGANPITGAEALAQNFDHYNTFTESSLRQILEFSGFRQISVFALKLYVFYGNPLNYAGMLLEALNNAYFSLNFKLYGKFNRIFSKKIAAVCRR
jgi:SAM-dependent methyltransferase